MTPWFAITVTGFSTHRDPFHGPWLGPTAGYVLLHFATMVVTESASSQGQAPALQQVE